MARTPFDFEAEALRIAGVLGSDAPVREVAEHALRVGYNAGYNARIDEVGGSNYSLHRPAAVRVNGAFLGKTSGVEIRREGETGPEVRIELDRDLAEDIRFERPSPNVPKPPRAPKPISAELALLLLAESDLLDDIDRKSAINGLIQRLAAML